ncbi:MAG: response regulator [Limnobacter sp.]|uniref:response regulator n=1 Tax=Limnobacter sp. TaxID=2003368 RepID=UPI00391AA6BE
MKNILLVDDHVIVRAGIRRLIESIDGFRVLAEAGTADEAYSLVGDLTFDLVILDMHLKESSGLDLIRRILQRNPSQWVVVLSMHDHPSYITQAIRAGAIGYLTKDAEPHEMIAAIRTAMKGQRALSQKAQMILAECTLSESQSDLGSLSAKEFDIFRMMTQGYTHAQIASTLHLSSKTISNYMTSIRQKLNADSDFKLLQLAMQEGLCASTVRMR